MSIQTELSRIINAKAAIKAAIEGKGVTVPDATLLDGMAALIESIETGGGSGGGQAFQCGSVVSADGTNLVVPCTLDNILIVRNYPPSSKNTIYLLNATLLLAQGLKFEISTTNSPYLTNQGDGKFSIAKENGQTTFTEKSSSLKFTGEYCYIAWDNAE